jgi:hypothetical protein
MSPVAVAAGAGSGGGLGLQTQDAWQWVFVVVPVLVWLAAFAALLRRSRQVAPREGRAARVAVGMERPVGLPAWLLAGAGTALWGLVVAFVGFVWDVVWHADTGRDKELFTVPHSLIILGLGAIFVASLMAIGLATARRVPVGRRIGPFQVPWSSLPLLLLGGAAVAGFPLDDFWHATYGIDVTMWSPTHLLMIGGASFTPLAVWLMLVEGGARRHRWGRRLWIVMAGLTLVGLSTFQLEYDLGIPQWQMLFQPLLIAAAAGFALVAARVSVGRGGAVYALVVYYLSRGPVAVMLSAGLGHSLPKFPLYLGEALCVELAFALPLSRARAAQLGGLLVATVGLATEWGWTHLWYQYPWQPSLLRYVWLAVLAAVATSLLGYGAGRILGGAAPPCRRGVVAVALVVLGAVLAVHLPLRSVDGAVATVHASPAVGATPVLDSQGLIEQPFDVTVALQPPTAARGVDRFDIVAWQGHAPVEHIELRETAPGHFVSEGSVPVGGTWKSLVMLTHGDVMDAVPVAMPSDPQAGLPTIHAPTSPRTMRFLPAQQLLMREVHGAAEWPFIVVLTLFALAVIAWVTSLATSYAAVGRAVRATGERPLMGRRVSPVRAPAAAARR